MSRLQQLIQKSGMSQVEIAKAADVDPATLSQYINQPEKIRVAKVETLIKICDVLNCSPVEIIEGAFWARNEWETMQKMDTYTQAELVQIFSSPEKHYLCDMLNGSIYSHQIHPREYLKVQIVDSDVYNNAGANWKVDVKALVKKIDSLTSHQCYMVIKTVSQFWEETSEGNKIDICKLFEL